MSLDYREVTIRKFSGLTDRAIDSDPSMFSQLHNFRLDKNGNPVLREGCERYAYGNADLPKILRRNKAENLYGVSLNHTFYQDSAGGIQSGAVFFNPESPEDVFASANHWRGIEYLTFSRDKSINAVANNTTRFHLFSLYMESVPDDLVPSSFVPQASQTGCPHLDVAPEIGQAGFFNNQSPTQYYIAYRQRVEANQGTVTPVTQDSFGQGVYSEVIDLDRERVESPSTQPSAVNIADIKSPYRDDYDELPVAVIYRTHPLDLNTFYKVGEVTFTSALPEDFIDTVYDDELLDNERLYISEGIVEMEQPPKHSCSTIINGTAFYGNIELYDETSGVVRTYQEYNYKIIQSMQGNPTMVNRTFFVDFEDEVIGLGGLHNALIVFTRSKIVRIDGFKNNDGSGGYNQRTISDDAGCVSHKSIISDGDNLYFFGNSGVYMTNGYDVVKISSTQQYDITETYQEYIKDYNNNLDLRPVDLLRDQATGYYDSRRDVLYWAVCDDGSPITNELLVYDKFNSCFYTLGGNSQSYPAMLIEEDYFLRADERTSIFIHQETNLSDLVAVNETEAEWFENYIPYSAKTVGIDFGNPSIKKWVTYLMMTLTTKSKMGMGMRSINDISNAYKQMKAITIDDVMLWRDVNLRWRDPSMRWRAKNTTTHKRRFPKKGLRCRYKQVEIAPVETVLHTSETFDTVSVESIVTPNGTEFKVSFDKFDYYHDVSVDVSNPLDPQYDITKPNDYPTWVTLCYDENGNPCAGHVYQIDRTIYDRIVGDPLSTIEFTTADPSHTIQVDWDVTVGQENRFNVTIRDAGMNIIYPDFRITSNFTSKTWPNDAESYQIKFEEEDYGVGYTILSIDNSASIPFITTNAGGNLSIGSGKLFEIHGIRKRQSFKIENLTLKFAPLSEKGAEYLAEGVDSGN